MIDIDNDDNIEDIVNNNISTLTHLDEAQKKFLSRQMIAISYVVEGRMDFNNWLDNLKVASTVYKMNNGMEVNDDDLDINVDSLRPVAINSRKIQEN